MNISKDSYFLGSLATFDLILTNCLIQTGKFWEANPILSFYLNLSLYAFILIKLLLIFGPIYVLEILRIKRPNVKYFIKSAFFFIFCLLCCWNKLL